MYVSLHFPFAPQYFPQKARFSCVFAKRTTKNIEFFQIFGERMQEAQASQKAGRGNRAWDPCFATPAPQKTYVIDVGRGGFKGGGYPLSSSKYPTRRTMSADLSMSPLGSVQTEAHVRLSQNGPECEWNLPKMLARRKSLCN